MGVGVLMPRPLWLSYILPGYTIDITEKKLENDRVCSRHFYQAIQRKIGIAWPLT